MLSNFEYLNIILNFDTRKKGHDINFINDIVKARKQFIQFGFYILCFKLNWCFRAFQALKLSLNIEHKKTL